MGCVCVRGRERERVCAPMSSLPILMRRSKSSRASSAASLKLIWHDFRLCVSLLQEEYPRNIWSLVLKFPHGTKVTCGREYCTLIYTTCAY